MRMSLRDMQILKSEKKILGPPSLKSWGRPWNVTVGLNKFPDKRWSSSGLDKLIRKIDDTGVQTTNYILMVMVDLYL